MSARIPLGAIRRRPLQDGRVGEIRSAAFAAGAVFVVGLLLKFDPAMMAARPVHPAFGELAQALSRSADGRFLFPVALATLGVFAATGRLRLARWVGVMILGAVVCGLSANVFRGLIGRTRPEAPVEQGWFGPRKDGRWIVGKHAYSSFPSGHTAAAAGFGLVLFLRGRREGLLGTAYAMSVAWSRVQLGVHRPSDVAAGFLLSAVVLFLLRDRFRALLGIHAVGDWKPVFPVGSEPRKEQGLADDSQDLVPT